MKIHIAGAYALADGYLGAAEALRQFGHIVTFSPMMAYSHENLDTHVNRVIADIQNVLPDVVLWWRAETLTPNELAVIRKSVPGIFAMYSWDPMTLWENEEVSLGGKCKSIEIVFTCCKPSIPMYEKYGCKTIYAPPGFDPTVHYPEHAKEYECDISIVCTNFYHGNAITKVPHISRKELLYVISENMPDVNLKVYGYKNIGAHFPQHYAGWANFSDSHKIFYNSKINLCTHLRPDTDMYYNERVTQILGSKGLLFVDYVAGLEKTLDIGKECVVMDFSSPQKLVEQIRYLLDNYDNIAPDIKEKGYAKAKEKLTWLHWAKIINAELGKIQPNQQNKSTFIFPAYDGEPDLKYSTNILRTCYIEDRYKIRRLAGQIDVLIDVGAMYGVTSRIALESGCKKIYAFEKDPVCFEAYKRNILDNAEEGMCEAFLMKVTGKKYGDIPSIEDILEKEKNKRIFLKIDIEGWEYPLLSSLNESGVINIPAWIVGEFHNFNEQHPDFSIMNIQSLLAFFKSLDRSFILPRYTESSANYATINIIDLLGMFWGQPIE